MTRLFALVFAGLLAGSAIAQDSPDLSAVELWQAEPATVFAADELDLSEFVWIARPS